MNAIGSARRGVTIPRASREGRERPRPRRSLYTGGEFSPPQHVAPVISSLASHTIGLTRSIEARRTSYAIGFATLGLAALGAGIIVSISAVGAFSLLELLGIGAASGTGGALVTYGIRTLRQFAKRREIIAGIEAVSSAYGTASRLGSRDEAEAGTTLEMLGYGKRDIEALEAERIFDTDEVVPMAREGGNEALQHAAELLGQNIAARNQVREVLVRRGRKMGDTRLSWDNFTGLVYIVTAEKVAANTAKAKAAAPRLPLTSPEKIKASVIIADLKSGEGLRVARALLMLENLGNVWAREILAYGARGIRLYREKIETAGRQWTKDQDFPLQDVIEENSVLVAMLSLRHPVRADEVLAALGTAAEEKSADSLLLTLATSRMETLRHSSGFLSLARFENPQPGQSKKDVTADAALKLIKHLRETEEMLDLIAQNQPAGEDKRIEFEAPDVAAVLGTLEKLKSDPPREIVEAISRREFDADYWEEWVEAAWTGVKTQAEEFKGGGAAPGAAAAPEATADAGSKKKGGKGA